MDQEQSVNKEKFFAAVRQTDASVETSGSGDDIVSTLGHFTGHPNFVKWQPKWGNNITTLFCRLVRAVHQGGLDLWFITDHKRRIRFGRKDKGEKNGKPHGYITLHSDKVDVELNETDEFRAMAKSQVTEDIVENMEKFAVTITDGKKSESFNGSSSRQGFWPDDYDKGELVVEDQDVAVMLLEVVSKNLILYGPPGTGKTYNLINEALKACNKQIPSVRKEAVAKFNELRNAGQIDFVTFHQSYSYEEFVAGIRPVLKDDNDGSKDEDGIDGQPHSIGYKLEKGIFWKIVKRAKDNEKVPYVLLIDEINRGNISKIFGELITLVELDKRIDPQNPIQGMRVTLPYSKKPFGVPKNLSIIGTMNTADRSIALVDIALRRRFEFKEMMPTEDLIDKLLSQDVGGVNVGNLLKKINQRIEYLYDRDHVIGHAYLMNIESIDKLRLAFLNKIIPLLQEYFYGDWKKICLVLGCPVDENGNQNNTDSAMIKAENKDLGYAWPDYEKKPTFRIHKDFENPDCTELKKFFDAVIKGSGNSE